MTQFYNRFKNYNQNQLFNIVLNPDDFQLEAINAAKKIIAENNWTNLLDKKIEEANNEKIKQEEILLKEIAEQAEHYKNVVELKNENNYFQIRIVDIPKFEAALELNGIDFYREDKNIGGQLDHYPTQTYFFRIKDSDKVNSIVKNLGIVTAPYSDIKPFFNFQLKIVLIVVILSILISLIF